MSDYLDLNRDPNDGTLDVHSVILDNIANLENDPTNTLDDHVIISLVNVEEESVYKNLKPFQKNQESGTVEYVNPPVFLNLYILFSCTLPTSVK